MRIHFGSRTWILWSLGAVLLWGAWGILAKEVLGRLDWQLVATLSFAGCLIPVLVVARCGLPMAGVTSLDCVRGVILGALAQVAILCFYIALETGQASVVVPLTALYPALTVVASAIFLGETLTKTQALGVVLALAAGLLLASG